MTHDEATKNHPGGPSDDSSHEKLAGMYETSEENDGKHWKYDDEVRYNARPIGVNKLDGMMKDISRAAELSKAYTNHSVRATAITLWSNASVHA